MDDEIKTMIKREKKGLFQSKRKFGNLNFAILTSLTLDISNAVTSSKILVILAYVTFKTC